MSKLRKKVEKRYGCKFRRLRPDEIMRKDDVYTILYDRCDFGGCIYVSKVYVGQRVSEAEAAGWVVGRIKGETKHPISGGF